MKRTFTVWLEKGWGKNDDSGVLRRLDYNQGLRKAECEYGIFSGDKLKVEKVRVTIESIPVKGGSK